MRLDDVQPVEKGFGNELAVSVVAIADERAAARVRGRGQTAVGGVGILHLLAVGTHHRHQIIGLRIVAKHQGLLCVIRDAQQVPGAVVSIVLLPSVAILHIKQFPVGIENEHGTVGSEQLILPLVVRLNQYRAILPQAGSEGWHAIVVEAIYCDIRVVIGIDRVSQHK